MADWTYVPQQESHVRERSAPRVIVNRFGDGKETRRQVETFITNRWQETYILAASERDTAQDFYDLKGLLTAFTKLAYDDAGSPTSEQTVRFDGPWVERRLSSDDYEVVLTFLRVAS